MSDKEKLRECEQDMCLSEKGYISFEEIKRIFGITDKDLEGFEEVEFE